jgi:hypothetical protein
LNAIRKEAVKVLEIYHHPPYFIEELDGPISTSSNEELISFLMYSGSSERNAELTSYDIFNTKIPNKVNFVTKAYERVKNMGNIVEGREEEVRPLAQSNGREEEKKEERTAVTRPLPPPPPPRGRQPTLGGPSRTVQLESRGEEEEKEGAIASTTTTDRPPASSAWKTVPTRPPPPLALAKLTAIPPAISKKQPVVRTREDEGEEKQKPPSKKNAGEVDGRTVAHRLGIFDVENRLERLDPLHLGTKDHEFLPLLAQQLRGLNFQFTFL